MTKASPFSSGKVFAGQLNKLFLKTLKEGI